MPLEAFFFDMNGVIVDDECVHEGATRSVLEPYGVCLSAEEYQQYCLGKADPVMMAALLDRFGDRLGRTVSRQAWIEQLVDQKNKAYEAHLEEVQPVPGIIDLINRLCVHLCLGIVSGARLYEIRTHLDRLNIDRSLFSVIVSNESLPKSKPDPAPYLLAANAVGIHPAHCAGIEDSAAGVASLKAAGMTAIGFHNPSYKATEFRQVLQGADVEIEDLSAVDIHFLRRLTDKTV